MNTHVILGGVSWSNPPYVATYQEPISYDPNGNILTYCRNGASTGLDMDKLKYHYQPGINMEQKGKLLAGAFWSS